MRLFSNEIQITVSPLHETGDTGLNGFSEGPRVQFVQGLVINIGTLDLRRQRTTTVMLLFITDEMLGTGDDASILNALDGLGSTNTSQERISAKSFPVSTTGGDPSQIHHGRKSNIGTLVTELFSHSMRAFVDEIPVPCAGCVDTSGTEKIQRSER
jgi:hypothetical protein